MKRAACWWLFGPAALWCIAVVGGLTVTAAGIEDRSVDRRGAEVAGSRDCRRCHPDAYESWHRSYHRTMTQAVSQTSVLAPFAGEHLDYLGFRATMSKTEAGVPRVRIVPLAPETGEPREDRPVLDVEVLYTVGSHHYQQYLARVEVGGENGVLRRLPVAWHIGEQRWIHMNGAFLEPEGARGSERDYLRHLDRWNDNCIFCHNTEPVPGKMAEQAFASTVGELGIACEACHGPGSLHVGEHGNPLRRVIADVLTSNRADRSITHPGRLSADRESAICGRCHGQRIARDIDRVMERGDGFIPGGELRAVSRPIFRDSEVNGAERLFTNRFWPDGTPRLSAYEYQGLLLSPCHDGGEGLGCNDCHDMHGGEPDKQLRAGKERAKVCIDCHDPRQLSGVDRRGGHGGHGATIDCLDCHMPRTTYGLLQGMISHRVSVPTPAALVGRQDQPDACTQCHVFRSRAWAADRMADLGFPAEDGAGQPKASESWASRVVLDLHGGDPIQRSLAADALARHGAVGGRLARMAELTSALEDEYPVVRWIAWRGLSTLARRAETPSPAAITEILDTFDYLGSPQHRHRVAEALRRHLPPSSFARWPMRAAELAHRRRDEAIWIGE